MTVPVVLIEEHHEAFYVWRQALRRGFISLQTELLHIDQHEDLVAPTLSRPPPSLDASASEVLRFVHEELSIDSFIVPGLMESLISRVHWLSPDLADHTFMQHRAVALLGSKISFPYSADSDLSTFSPSSKVILDIDLDYFACNSRPRPAYTTVDVPKSVYDAFTLNRHHPMRLIFGSTVRGRESPEGFSLSFHGSPFPLTEPPPPTPVSNDLLRQIDSRIEGLTSALHRKGISPSLITLARSRFSGYTPQAFEIEEKILSRLGRYLHLNVMSWRDI